MARHVGAVPNEVVDARLPWWRSALERPKMSDEEESYLRSEFVIGWPFVAIQTAYEIVTYHDGGVDGDFAAFRFRWVGLAANVALFSFAWLFLLQAPRATRSGVRRARGRCAACGYDLRGSPSPLCSECGMDRVRSRQRAKANARIHAVIALAVALLVAVPIAQGWKRAADERSRFIAGGWIDAVLDGHYSFMSPEPDYADLVQRVRGIPGHEDVILARLNELSEMRLERMIDFVVEMATADGRESYLPIIDRCVALSEEARWRPMVAYRAYPWSTVGARLVEAYDRYAGEDAMTSRSIAISAWMVWRNHPEPAMREEVERFLLRLLEDARAHTAVVALRGLMELEWIDLQSARMMLDEIVERDPSVVDDVHYARIVNALR